MFTRKRLTAPTVIELTETTLQGLPAPEALIREAGAAFSDPVALLDLKHHYDILQRSPAWKHFLGRLLEMKRLYEQGILMGERDRFGDDLTDKMRASYATVLQILAIPGQVETIQRESEAAIVGLPQESYNPLANA